MGFEPGSADSAPKDKHFGEDIITGRRRIMKGQPAVEFLTIYSWVIISVMLVVVLGAAIASSNSKQAYPPAHCYITPSFPCYGAYIMTNSISSEMVVILGNGMGTEIQFPSNSFSVRPTFADEVYYGSCLASNSLPYNTIYCEAELGNYYPGIGTVLNPNFVINYRICTACSNTLPVYNTSGSALLTVSPYYSGFTAYNSLGGN